MFKKRFILTLVLIFAFCAIFTGCNNDEEKASTIKNSDTTVSAAASAVSVTSTITNNTTEKKTSSKKKKSKKATTTSAENYSQTYTAKSNTTGKRVIDSNGGCVGNNAQLY